MSDPQDFNHTPVMLSQCLDLLAVKAGRTYVDVTAGFGGHLQALASLAGPDARVIGIDRDEKALSNLAGKLPDNVELVHANYADLRAVLASKNISTIDGGILADLGVSSWQLDDPTRGFSFREEGPLDMRMDVSQSLTAADLVNKLQEKELADIIFQYGEERHSRPIAKAIVKARPILTTKQLAEVVQRVQARRREHGSGREPIHPATRTFQALRIAVNDELGNLETFLKEAISLLAPDARLVVITFHSLEDRLVKHIFRQAAASCLCPPRQPVCTCGVKPQLLVITRKPITADKKEVLANPRARSAKLRAGEKRS